MLDWLSENATLVQIAVQGLTAGIWIVYLHLLLAGFRRQRRSNLLISRAAGAGDRAHLMVSNLGAEPIDVVSVIADLEFEIGARRVGEGTRWASRTAVASDRNSDSRRAADDSLQATLKGPLESGEHRDLGSFADLMEAAMADLEPDGPEGALRGVALTVVAESGCDALLVAGRQRFSVVEMQDGRRAWLPRSARTEQVRAGRARRALARRLDAALRDEARRVERAARRGGDRPGARAAPAGGGIRDAA
ncbi:hypothetical protein P2H44_23710 [Albimonas sp. CAU 1670]|uniref:hypothetical protein n=1 Tax=Albimonas sp. CAU 1670 TaxID=3032599 RepID=UPI0023DC970C|nr:hypothetical protein [Albimonas sp. CAU 1670]MDF2235574.1 hypothetical protein [Albimonas sp. CAU 1670]